jgi:predicted lipoprotein with Yx(FWY)xxD motif
VRRPPVALAAIIGLSTALALSACGDDTPQALPASAPAAPPAAPTTAAAQPPAAPENQATNPNGGYWPASVNAADNVKLGPIVVDGEGFTLYRFDKDTNNPAKTTCFDACAMKWPPVLTRNKIVFHGIDKNKLGAIQRSDGTTQVTIDGWPAYRFSGDAKPGDITGEAVQGTWFAFAPTGEKANGDN